MRGTVYAIAEIALWMLAAAAVGGLIGWIVRGRWRDSHVVTQWEALARAEREQNDTLRGQLAAHSTTVSDLQSTLATASTRIDQLSGGVRDGDRRDLDVASARIVVLEARIAEMEDARVVVDTVASDAQAGDTVVRDVEVPFVDPGSATIAQLAARARGTGPIVQDDLKRIHGVGPKLEEMLKGMDITSFRQVARFTAADIVLITAALGAFPGRIERDNWTSSAAAEHHAKYGETLDP